MNFIITAGGTTEKIDPVRSITNSATGRLGSLTANELALQAAGRLDTIYYICEKGAALPECGHVETVFVQGVRQAQEALLNLLANHKIDAVIHSMAVSDYSVQSATTAQLLAQSLARKLYSQMVREFSAEEELAGFLQTCIEQNELVLGSGEKLSSHLDGLLLQMRRTPKLISLIKSAQPSTILVGFKLLSGVPRQRLLEAGFEVLSKNGCDLVLCNDARDICEGRHKGLLLRPDRSYDQFDTKEEIARGIAQAVLALLDGKGRTV